MNYFVVSTDVMLALMMLQQSGDFAPSAPMTFQYFFLVPEIFTTNLTENSKQLLFQIYDEHAEAFKISEPNDPNYIAVVDVTPRVLSQTEIAQMPWLTTRLPVWENSNCIVVQNNDYQKVERNNFSAILGLA